MTTGATYTGVPIGDESDYLDQQIPGINALSNITGTSFTGSIASLLSGQGLDPQAQVTKGNKGGFGSVDSGIAALNWATGMGLIDMSRPNYIDLAEIQLRDSGGGT
jgi:hypothetical protein